MSFVNRTIDDQNGDEVTGEQVSYSPAQLWTQGNGCGGCSSKPDAGQTVQHTWHDGSRNPTRDPVLSLSFKFTGTAVYLFNILDRGDVTDVNITIDGNFAGHYANEPSTSFVYNSLVFSQDNLPFGEHTVGMSAGGNDQVTILFDYALYTTTESGDSPSSFSDPSRVTSPEPSSNPENPSKSTSVSQPIITRSQAVAQGSSDLSTSSSTSLKTSSIPDLSSTPLSILSRVSSTTLSQMFTVTVGGNAGALQPSSTFIGSSSPSSSISPSPIGVSNSRSRHFNVGAIAGGIVGGLSFVLLFILFAWLWYRRRHRQPNITPFKRGVRGAELPVDSLNGEEKQTVTDDYPFNRKTSLLAPYSAVSLLRPTSMLAEREDTESSDVSHLELPSPVTSPSRVESEAALQRELQSLQGSLANARAMKGSGSGTAASEPSTLPTPNIVAPDDSTAAGNQERSSGEDVRRLRLEIEQLRASHQQHTPSSTAVDSEGPSSSSIAPSPLEIELMRQISILRTEMDHMRMQQELGLIDEALPSYSPPSRPIPGYNA